MRALVVGLGFVLTGCVSVGHEADASELPGQWYSSEKTSIRLELREDGTLMAKAWPENLGCWSDGTVDDFGRADRLDLAGQWSAYDFKRRTSIRVLLDTVQCGFPLSFHRRSDDVYLCVNVAGKAPDSLYEDEVLPFARSPELAQNAGDVCVW